MQRSPLPTRLFQYLKSVALSPFQYLKSLAMNPVLWGGLAVLVAAAVVFLLVLDRYIMPAYTRQEVAIAVPNVENMPFDHARQMVESYDLRVERVVQRFNPNFPRDVVVDQNPPPEVRVKPGRRIYLSVNSGAVPTVTVPRVEGLALREAKNRMTTAGLKVTAEQPDPIPSPYENTVTRQSPEAGETVDRGSGVTLWYSTGLGTDYVEVPDVVGKTVDEATEILLQQKLRSVAVDAVSGTDIIGRQSRKAGTRVRQGFEIRLFVSEADELETP